MEKVIALLLILGLALGVGALVSGTSELSPVANATASVVVSQIDHQKSVAQANIEHDAGATRTAAAATRTIAEFHYTTTVAAATATARADQAIAEATQVSVQNSITLTRVAIPVVAGLTQKKYENEGTRDDAWTAGSLAIIVVLVLIGLALAGAVRSRSKQVRRDANGQLPVLYDKGVMTDPGTEIGTVIRHDPSWIEQFVFAMYVASKLAQRQMPDMSRAPHITIEKVDGNANAGHYLAAHQANQPALIAAAVFQPEKRGLTDRGPAQQQRGDRWDLMNRMASHPAGLSQPTTLGLGNGAGHEPIIEVVQGLEAEAEGRLIAQEIGQTSPHIDDEAGYEDTQE
jgi:hypothetical protein